MSYETILIDYINTLERNNTVRPLILGGTSAINGGEGGPPGGFIGYLPQWKVAYDLTEAATLVTVASGESLLDNLNHIRYRIGYLETTLSGGVGIEEAPIDGTPYVREDANWVGIDYEPADITIVKTGQVNWIDLTDGGETTLHTHVGISGGGGIEEAPITGKQYGREDADWTEIIVIEEAPIDTLTYGRKDAGWIAVTVSGVGIEEAPIDGTPYSRQDADWVAVTISGGGGIEEAPIDGTPYSRQDADWVSASAGSGIPVDGWIACTGTWTNVTGSANDPTFVISVNNDQTGIISNGIKLKLTNTTVKYFIVTYVGAYSGGVTLITVYGGMNYDLSGTTITSPYYSPIKAPFGFSLRPVDWDCTKSWRLDKTEATPTAGTWYNITYADIPIGDWIVSYDCTVQVISSFYDSTAIDISTALSTTNNGVTEIEGTCTAGIDTPSLDGLPTSLQTTFHREFNVRNVAKIRYYLNWMTNNDNIASLNHYDEHYLHIRYRATYL